MAGANELTAAGNLAALPITLKWMHDQWTQQRAAQNAPTAQGALAIDNPQAAAQMPPSQPSGYIGALGPEPPDPTRLLQTPVVGPMLRGIGVVGQVLQAMGAPPPKAPRPMTPLEQQTYQKGVQQQAAGGALQDAFARGAPASEIPGIMAPSDPSGAARLYTQGQTPPGLGNELSNNFYRAKAAGMDDEAARAYADFQTHKSKIDVARQVGAAGAEARQTATIPTELTPLAIRSIFAKHDVKNMEEAQSKGLIGTMYQEAVDAIAAQKGAEKTDFSGRAAVAALPTIQDAKASIQRLRAQGILTDDPLWGNLGANRLKLLWAANVDANPDAVNLGLFLLWVPQIARALGEQRTNVLQEQRLREGLQVGSVPGKTATEQMNVVERVISRMADQRLHGTPGILGGGTPTPGNPNAAPVPPATPNQPGKVDLGDGFSVEIQ